LYKIHSSLTGFLRIATFFDDKTYCRKLLNPFSENDGYTD